MIIYLLYFVILYIIYKIFINKEEERFYPYNDKRLSTS